MAISPWTPSTEAEVQQACSDHVWVESHYWDAKSALPSGDKHNIDIAIDIASFAVDGGVIFIGLREIGQSGTFKLNPVSISGMGERIERIALTRIAPPVYVRTSVIESDRGGGLGYILVHVEPSPSAPHQVQGTYRSRGDKTNTTMSDEEVAVSMQRRFLTRGAAHRLLSEEVARDPFPESKLSHLYMVAEPLTAQTDAASAIHRSGEASRTLGRIINIQQLAGFSRTDEQQYPTAGEPGHFERRGQGAAMTASRIYGTARRVSGVEARDTPFVDGELIDVEFLRSGGLRVFLGGISPVTDRTMNGIPVSNASPVVWTGAVVRAVRRLLAWTAEYANVIGYRGSWTFGVHVSNLRGKPADAESARGGFRPLSQFLYDRDEYEQTTQATTDEVSELPWQVAERLVEPFLTTFGTSPTLHHLITSPAL